MEPESFVHRPLAHPESTIRLLKFDGPTSGDTDTNQHPVSFQLIETSLASAPSYWALSYVWGSDPPNDIVHCNNRRLHVTASCAAALRQLASEPYSCAHYLWVDAICIDQGSVVEKNYQITLMSDIYSHAAQVIVWLGPDDKDSSAVITLLNRLAKLAQISPALVSAIYRRITRRTVALTHASLSPGGARFFTLFPGHLFQEYDAFRAVCRAPWHDRLWTLQEIVLARRATVRAGARAIAWHRLDRIAGVIAAQHSGMGFTRYPGDSFQRVRVVSSLRGLLRREQMPKERYRLPRGHPLGSVKAKVSPDADAGIASHFMMGCALAASDARDKVYGQYAILQRHGVKLAPPDYERPLAEIYKDAARAIIEHDKSLEMLCYVSAERQLSGLPSWVPDFSYTWFSWIPGYEFTAAAGNSKPRFRFDNGGNLCFHAALVDRIRRKSESMSFFLLLSQDKLDSEAIMALFWQLQRIIRFVQDTKDGTIAGNDMDALCMVLMQEIALSCSSTRKWATLLKEVTAWANTITEEIPQFPPASGPTSKTADIIIQTTEGVPTPDTEAPPSPISTTPGPRQSPTPAPPAPDPKATDTATGDEPYEPSEPSDPIAPINPAITKLAANPASMVIQHMAITRLDGNSLFRTEGGRLGVATCQIEEGDGVYIVPGMRLPLIARKLESGGYKLIGATFLDKAMRGELWRGWDSDEVEELRAV